jgi:Zn-dependent protease with chaperone function
MAPPYTSICRSRSCDRCALGGYAGCARHSEEAARYLGYWEFSLGAAVWWLALLPLGSLVLAVGSASRVIAALFSRARELEADAGAARLTGNPSALASALTTLSDKPRGVIPGIDLRRAVNLDVFHIIAIGKEHRLMHTHPPLTRRLKQLAEIETRLQSRTR